MRCLLTPVFIIGLLAAAANGQDRGAEQAESRSAEQAAWRSAVAAGLKLVQVAAANYPKHRECFSCHHQTLPLLAMTTARRHGLAIDEGVLKQQAEFTRNSFHSRIRAMQEGKGVGGASLTVGYGLWALELAAHPHDETTEAMVAFLLKRQEKAGHWHRSTKRPPLEDSDVTCTALAAYYMQEFAGESQRAEVEQAVARGKTWLATADTPTQEDKNAKLWACSLLACGADQIAAARQTVLDAQREDGGWAQLDDMPSDAYATGQSLYILQATGLATSDPRYRRGMAFLVDTQLDDGSWFVKSRSKPIQRMFDNGDPHGTDQFISTPATSWAVAALAAALDAESPDAAADKEPADQPGKR